MFFRATFGSGSTSLVAAAEGADVAAETDALAGAAVDTPAAAEDDAARDADALATSWLELAGASDAGAPLVQAADESAAHERTAINRTQECMGRGK